jgi:hypothetical protein
MSNDGLPSCTGAEKARLTVTCEDDMMGENSARFKAKRERAKQGLIAILPPLDQVQRLSASNGDWWHTWRRKCSGTSDPEQSLSDFASKALADGNIGAIGTVVLAVGICSADENDVEKYIEAVDRYVLSDDEYAATLEGMECLILKSKWYADVGQPRRAWISYRKGLMYSQLMVCLLPPMLSISISNLYRDCTGNGLPRQLTRASGGRYTMVTGSSRCSSAFPTAFSTAIAILHFQTWTMGNIWHP